jgi:hypothetical protein
MPMEIFVFLNLWITGVSIRVTIFSVLTILTFFPVGRKAVPLPSQKASTREEVLQKLYH